MAEEEQKINPELSPDSESEQKAKLDIKVLLSVIIGIGLVFVLMFAINDFIFSNVAQEKTAVYFSIFASNILFMLLVLIIKTDRRLTWQDLGWRKVAAFPAILDTFKMWVLTWIIHIAYVLTILSRGITPPENELAKLLQNPSVLTLLLNIFIIALAAPIIEETLFRGLLFGSLRTYCGTWTAIVLSAAIFSALHFELVGFIPRFVLGLALGYLYVKNNSILPAIGLHALNNLLAVIMVSMV